MTGGMNGQMPHVDSGGVRRRWDPEGGGGRAGGASVGVGSGGDGSRARRVRATHLFCRTVVPSQVRCALAGAACELQGPSQFVVAIPARATPCGRPHPEVISCLSHG